MEKDEQEQHHWDYANILGGPVDAAKGTVEIAVGNRKAATLAHLAGANPRTVPV